MITRFARLPLVATLALSVVITKAVEGSVPRGVSPSSAHLYVPDKASQWRCLDGSKTIPFSAVNDDYCDCKDGSDEPGTSACGTGFFYCANVGHVGSYIKSSRVNDGVCDAECCDGSDEFDGQIQCPNNCEEVGAKSREEQARIKAIEEEGSRLRKEYAHNGKETKARLQKELEELKATTGQREKATQDARDKLDEANEKQEKYRESTKGDREAARKIQLEPLLQEQRRRLKVARETENHLFKTLQNVKHNHNKNYHDLAVKNTVSGFDEFVSRQKEDESKDEQEAGDEAGEEAGEEGAEEDDTSSAESQLETLISDTTIVLRDISSLYELLDVMRREYNTEYNDEAVLAAVKVVEGFEDKWDKYRQEFKDETRQTVPDEEMDSTPEAQKLKEEIDLAQAEYDATSDEESTANDRIQDINKKLEMDFGPGEEFAQLIDECFEFKDIEYTYSICLFGEAHQKSHYTTDLGKFSSWEGSDYTVQSYTGGTKCWNGPERSVRLEMSCGTKNELVSVAEPAKCEYLFKLQTPAVCPVLPENNGPEAAVVPEDAVSKGPEGAEGIKHDEL
ncbi:MAG: glucosidase II beta subunit-like-domain-containing protein [Benniella sp.]|nr:MAG: glucosidase II beta subunit-like-domain-containing protein [Benniella sp.]